MCTVFVGVCTWKIVFIIILCTAEELRFIKTKDRKKRNNSDQHKYEIVDARQQQYDEDKAHVQKKAYELRIADNTFCVSFNIYISFIFIYANIYEHKRICFIFFSCVLCCVCSFSRFRASPFFNVLYVYFHRLTLRQSFMQMKYTTKSHEFVFVCIVCIFVYICLNVSFCSLSLSLFLARFFVA